MLEQAITRGIQVEVESTYVPDQSNPEARQFFFSYRIRIKNQGRATVKLLTRHWIITDGNGLTEEVRGPGVIGQQPELGTDQSFEYESFCPLRTPTGTMRGSYEMLLLETGERFEVEIPQFFLVEPDHFH